MGNAFGDRWLFSSLPLLTLLASPVKAAAAGAVLAERTSVGEGAMNGALIGAIAGGLAGGLIAVFKMATRKNPPKDPDQNQKPPA